MNPEPPIPNSPEPEGRPMSLEEFTRWAKENPEGARAHRKQVKERLQRTLNGEFGEVTPEIRANAEQVLAKVRESESLDPIIIKFAELKETMGGRPGSMTAEERLKKCNALADEITDLLLETPEPHRSRFLKGLLPLRDRLRALKA